MNSPSPLLPPELAERVAQAGAIPSAPPGALQRVRLRLEATLRWGGPPATVSAARRWFGGGSPGPVAGLPLPSAGAAWLLGVGVLVLGATTAAVLMRHPIRHSAVEPMPEAPPAAVDLVPVPAPLEFTPEPAEAPPPAPTVEPARAAKPAVRRSAGIETGRAFDDRLASESRLLDLARVALAEGDIRRSLAALEQHRRTFPEGQLLPQREALRIEALVASGDYPAALAAANAFRHRFPESLLKVKIDRLLRDLPDELREE
jgi:hypothetical protein